MFEDPIDPLLRQALIDRCDEGGELATLLQLTVEDILDAFPERVELMESELRELCDLQPKDEADD